MPSQYDNWGFMDRNHELDDIFTIFFDVWNWKIANKQRGCNQVKAIAQLWVSSCKRGDYFGNCSQSCGCHLKFWGFCEKCGHDFEISEILHVVLVIFLDRWDLNHFEILSDKFRVLRDSFCVSECSRLANVLLVPLSWYFWPSFVNSPVQTVWWMFYVRMPVPSQPAIFQKASTNQGICPWHRISLR